MCIIFADIYLDHGQQDQKHRQRTLAFKHIRSLHRSPARYTYNRKVNASLANINIEVMCVIGQKRR